MVQQLCRPLLRRTSFLAAWLCALTLTPVHARPHGPLHEQIEEVTREIEKTPGSAELFWRRAELHRLRGDRPAAEADYNRAAELDPHLRGVQLGRARLYLDWGRPEKALEAVNDFLSHKPRRTEAMFVRARALAAIGRTEDAVCQMDRAIAIAPHPRPAHYIDRARLIVCGSRGGPDSIDRAVRGLDAGLDRLGPAVTLQLYAIELEEARGRYDEALERLDRLAAQYARPQVLLKRRGEILEAAGRRMEAQAAYTEALEALLDLPDGVRSAAWARALETFVRHKLRSSGPEEVTR